MVAEQYTIGGYGLLNQAVKPGEQPIIAYFTEVIGWENYRSVKSQAKSETRQVNCFVKAGSTGAGKQT